jgi:hypothetical protein
MGNGVKRVIEREKPILKKLRRNGRDQLSLLPA